MGSKGRSGTIKRFHIKRTVQEEQKWKQLKQKAITRKSTEEDTTKKVKKPKGPLERL